MAHGSYKVQCKMGNFHSSLRFMWVACRMSRPDFRTGFGGYGKLACDD
jgi:hypothetical protein